MKIKMLETVETKIYVPIDGGAMPAPMDDVAAKGGEISRDELRPERGAAEYVMVWKLVAGGTYDSIPKDAGDQLIADGFAEVA